MAVPQEQGAVAHPVIDVLVAVDVPLARAGRTLDIGRKRQQMADVVGDAARDRAPRALPQRGGLGVLGAVLLVDRHGRLLGCPAPIIPERAANPGTPIAASRNRSTIAAWVSADSPSTVCSRRLVTPSHAPTATQAVISRRSSSGVWRRSLPTRRPSAATMP